MANFKAVILALAFVTMSVASCVSTYTNPILPGWHSDPSCIRIPEWDDTYFCTTSTFIAFPGLPIYASKDLINWRLVSNALNRVDQIPELAISAPAQQEGTYANTLRFHDGVLYLITPYLSSLSSIKILVFSTTNAYDDAAWSEPIEIENPSGGGDPDLFWDEDGKLYVSQSFGGEYGGIWTSEVDLQSDSVLQTAVPWRGTGGRWPEGPHIYKKDGWYYMIISEGGTELLHSLTIARSKSVLGPYEGYEGNPILTNRGTDEYFQCVGHADLFQDVEGNWWGVALASRSGPKWEIYPMGRETVLFPMQWDTDAWPVLEQVRGRLSGPLPPKNENVPGSGPWVSADEFLDFQQGSILPGNWHHWRAPSVNLFEISPQGHPSSLQVTPSVANLTSYDGFDPRDGLAFIGRVQSHTLFNASVDITFQPTSHEEEAGVTLFLTQYQHVDLGIVGLSSDGVVSKHLRFRATTFGKPEVSQPAQFIRSVPESWSNELIQLTISTISDTGYRFLAAPASRPTETLVLGEIDGKILSGGSGPFSGTLVGLFATANGGNGTTAAFFSNWTYQGIGQKIDHEEYI